MVVQRNCLVVCSVEQIPLHIWCVYLCSVFNELSLSFCWTTTFIVYHTRAVVVNTFLKVFLTSFRSDVVCFNNFHRVSRLWLEVNNFFWSFFKWFPKPFNTSLWYCRCLTTYISYHAGYIVSTIFFTFFISAASFNCCRKWQLLNSNMFDMLVSITFFHFLLFLFSSDVISNDNFYILSCFV